jgi:hypothetical protein
MRTLVGFGLQGRDIVMHAVLKWAKVWYPYILRSHGVHYRNIWGIGEGCSTWALPCKPPCVLNLIC